MQESSRAYVSRVIKREGIAWPHYFSSEGMENEFAQRFGLTGIPEYFLLDRNGLLIWQRSSSKKVIAELEALIQEHLGAE